MKALAGLDKENIAMIGLGYVGLPLAVEFGKSRPVSLTDMPAGRQYAAIVMAVGHRQFVSMGENGIKALGLPNAVLFDVKTVLPLGASDGRL